MKTWFFKKWGKNSVYLGIRKAYSIPTLPPKVETLYNHIFFRIFRVIGGTCFLLIVTKFYLNLPEILQLFCTIIGSIQITQVIIIFLIKFCYGIYTLIYKKEIFEVRNSPLNRYATLLGKVIYCAKVGCTVSGAGASIIAGGVAYDTLLEQSGRNKIFLPFMAQTYNSFFGEGPNNKLNINTLIDRNKITETETPIKQESVTEMVDKYRKLTPAEKLDFMTELNSSYDAEVKSRSSK